MQCNSIFFHTNRTLVRRGLFTWTDVRQHVTAAVQHAEVWLSEEEDEERQGEKTKVMKSGSD